MGEIVDKVNDFNIAGKLWSMASKLQGVGEILEFTQTELSETGKMGIGQILQEFSRELDAIKNEFEEREYKPTREIAEDNEDSENQNKEGDENGTTKEAT